MLLISHNRISAFTIACFVIISINLYSQSNQRVKKITPYQDSILLDTLSIIPGTTRIKHTNGQLLDSNAYRFDYVNAMLILNSNRKSNADTLIIAYKVFPFLFSKKNQHKDLSRIQNNQWGGVFTYTPEKDKTVDFFKTEGLTKSGSISRGLSFGNNQDVVLNSNLNIQLAGKISDNIDLLLAATDQNIPIQPEGNTQQLQEFDKVFIRFGIDNLPKNGRTVVTAGDFQIGKPAGYFMNFNKKAQGLSFETKISNPYKEHTESLIVKGSAAVSRGKFARNISLENSNGNTFNGQKQERNQGPYKLRGVENEQYIIVLAGTEAIYIDGKRLERGQENDYTIDYNTAEIIFTPKNLITKDKRISIEFQYSDKNYARSLAHAGAEYASKKVNARINIFSEQDNKNKPLQQELTNSQKLLLASVGDSLQNAVWSTADSILFNGTEVLYDKKDTAIGSFQYQNIFVYSIDSAKAHFRANFSFVGLNKGNYVPKQSAANGKVYQWVAPDTITGMPRGSYEPVTLLISPKQKQMISAGADLILGKNSTLSIEGAGSNNDINTFSVINKANDDGFAGKLDWNAHFPISSSKNILADSSRSKKDSISSWSFITNINYEVVQKTFSFIERFRSVEFERDWNRLTISQIADQHIIGGMVGLKKNNNVIEYNYKSFLEGSTYDARRHAATVLLSKDGFILAATGSYLNSSSISNKTNYIRNKTELSKEFIVLRSKIKAAIREQHEQNLLKRNDADSLLGNSFQFLEIEPYVEYMDSSQNKYTLTYKQRTDYAFKNALSPLKKATYAQNYGIGIELMKNPNSQLRITGNYRILKIIDTVITTQKPENTLLGRTEYNLSLLKGFFTAGTFYEIGSGLELKRDFLFLEVAAGQGTHIWTDYNKNGIKELNEFEISPFPYEANYIKVWVPSDNYINAYTNQFSQVITLTPNAIWGNKKRLKRFIARFTNQTSYKTDRKTTNNDLALAYNPFLSDTKDTTLVTLNSSLRNTVFFNQSSPVFGMDFTVQDLRNKTLLENDNSSRQNNYAESTLRLNINTQWSLLGSYKGGIKRNDSKFFTSRNYKINYIETEPKISFQPTASFRVIASYKYMEKKNTISGISIQAKAISQNFGGELKYNAVNKGSFSAKTNFIVVSYNDEENNPVAYEMLEGLKPGKNYTWNISYNRTLASNIQLTLSYDGRQSPGVKAIHTGNAQVRAYF